MEPARADVLWAQSQLFNRLCSVYVHTRDVSFLRGEDLKKEVGIPDHLFNEALLAFKVGGRLTVEVIESGGESYLRLGQHGRDNLRTTITQLRERLEKIKLERSGKS